MIRRSFSAQLSLWVADFVIAISAVVIILIARFSEQVIRDESIDTTQQTLENTALRIRNAISQARIIAQLEHEPFNPDKAYIEKLLEERKPRQFSQIRVVDYREGAGQSSFSQLSYHGVPSYRFSEPVIENQYGLEVIISTKSIYIYFLNIQQFLALSGVLGVLLLLIICWIVIARHLRPLRQLATSAQRISGGHLDELIPDSSRRDEIGKLQHALAKMQRSLNSYLEEIRSKQSVLSSQNTKLQEAYSEIKEYDELKNKFISEMTCKMSTHVKSVCQNTEAICDGYSTMTESKMTRIQTDILTATEELTLLLDQLLNNPKQAGLYDASTDTPTTPLT